MPEPHHQQPDLFDLLEGARQRDEGMEVAALSRAELLEYAREIAINVALHNEFSECTIDDVRWRLSTERKDRLGNAAGSVFKGSHWIATGNWVPSTKTSNHGRHVRVWRLKENRST